MEGEQVGRRVDKEGKEGRKGGGGGVKWRQKKGSGCWDRTP